VFVAVGTPVVGVGVVVGELAATVGVCVGVAI